MTKTIFLLILILAVTGRVAYKEGIGEALCNAMLYLVIIAISRIWNWGDRKVRRYNLKRLRENNMLRRQRRIMHKTYKVTNEPVTEFDYNMVN